MEKIVYSKYSNQRNPKYCIRTDIVETEQGCVVRKMSTGFESVQHVDNIVKINQQLSEVFEGTNLVPNRILSCGDYVEFEYINGSTLEEILDGYLASGDMVNFEKLLHSFADVVKQVYERETFETSEQFEEVFGTQILDSTTRAGKAIDIDLIFSNVVCDESKWTVIDYEWTFDFLIPVDYILWRACITYLDGAVSRKKLSIFDLCKMVGVDTKNLVAFENMERHFQYDYCYADVKALPHLYVKMGQPVHKGEQGAKVHVDSNLRTERELAQARKQIEEIYQSTSWRITSPIRKISGFAKNIKNKKKNKKSDLKQESIKKNKKKVTVRGNIQPHLCKETGKKIAVHMHLYYEDLLEEFCGYLNNITETFDLYVSCKEGANQSSIIAKANEIKNVNRITVKETFNRGRDIAPFYVLFRKELMKYDCLLHIHSKKSLYTGGEKQEWRHYALDGVLKNEAMVDEVLTKLLKEERVGLCYGEMSPQLSLMALHWLRNMAKSSEVCNKLGIPMDSEMLFYPVGSFFWANMEAIRPLFDLGLSYDDFDEEQGQIDGTLAHALERVIARVSSHRGYNSYIYDPESEEFSKNVSYKRFQDYFALDVDRCVAELSKYDVISFDIFDTLITRMVYKPGDVYRMMSQIIKEQYGITVDFVKLRIESEARATGKKGAWCNIDDIYDAMCEDTSLSREQIDTIKQLEIRLEYELCMPRKDAQAVFEKLVAMGKRIILVSDMYLKKDMIEAMLAKCGYIGYEDLWVSCELGLRKDNDSMWTYFFEQYGDYSTIHVGDHPQSDVQALVDIGKASMLWLSPRAQFRFSDQYEKFKEYIDTDISSSLVLGYFVNGCVYNSPFALRDTGHARIDNLQDLATGIFAPMFMAFAEFISKQNAKKLLFLAREGMFLEKLYETYARAFGKDEIEHSYFYTSRRAASVPQLRTEEDMRQLMLTNYQGRIDDLFRERLGLEIQDGRKVLLPEDIEDVMSILKEYDEPIRATVDEERKTYLGYLNNETQGLNLEDVCVVDVGYSGTIQSYLIGLTGNMIQGCYLATHYDVKPEKVGARCEGLYTFDQYPKFLDTQLFLEAVTAADHGQVLYMKNEDGAYVPVTKEDVPPRQDQIAIVQQSIMDYIEQLAEATSYMTFTMNPQLAEKIYEEITVANVMDNSMCDLFHVNDNYCMGNGSWNYDCENGTWKLG